MSTTTTSILLDPTTARDAHVQLKIDLPPEIKIAIDRFVKGSGNSSNSSSMELIALVLDVSGSMSGRPWQQVQGAVADLEKRIIDKKRDNDGKETCEVIIITYSHVANEHADFNFVSRARAGGATSFTAAFGAVTSRIKRRLAEKSFGHVTVCFMTDGQDTSVQSIGRINFGASMEAAETALEQFGKDCRNGTFGAGVDVTVHAIGFSKDHDFKYMSKMAFLGDGMGMFRYAEPEDGATQLQEKLDELFGFVLEGGRGKNPEVRIAVQILARGDAASRPVLAEPLTATVEIDVDEEGIPSTTLSADLWAEVPQDALLHDGASLSVVIDFGGGSSSSSSSTAETVVSATVVADADVRVPAEGSQERVAFETMKTERLVERLMAQMLEAQESRTELPAQWHEQLGTLQRAVASSSSSSFSVEGDKMAVNNFPHGIKNKRDRAEHLERMASARAAHSERMASIRERVNKMGELAAKIAVDGMLTVSELAKLKDQSYAHVFKKQRRNDIQNRRNAAFADQAKDLIKEISELSLGDEGDLDARISDVAKALFTCDLSTMDLVEMLCDDDPATRDEIMGVALAVQRSELAVDDPTLIKVYHVSNSILTRGAMSDARKYNLRIAGPAATHGGFEFSADGAIPAASTDRGRMPINTFLPLYICAEHWARVKLLLPFCVAEYATLDATAFAPSQLEVMFTILGTMISRLSATEPAGEREMQILFAFWRTCVAVMRDVYRPAAFRVHNFMASPEGRFKDKCSNMLTMLGMAAAYIGLTRGCPNDGSTTINEYLRSIDDNWSKRLDPSRQGKEGDDASPPPPPEFQPLDTMLFFELVRHENLRRGCARFFASAADDDDDGQGGGASEADILGVVYSLLGGRPDTCSCEDIVPVRTGAEFVKLVGGAFDPRAAVVCEAHTLLGKGAPAAATIDAEDIRSARGPLSATPELFGGVNVTKEKEAAAFARKTLKKTPQGWSPKTADRIPVRNTPEFSDEAASDDVKGGGRVAWALCHSLPNNTASSTTRAFFETISDPALEITCEALDGDANSGVAPSPWIEKFRNVVATRTTVSGCSSEEDTMIAATAAAVQAVYFRRNADARAALPHGSGGGGATPTYRDVHTHSAEGVDAARACLAEFHAMLQTKISETHRAFWVQQLQLRAVCKALAQNRLDDEDGDWAFVGFLMSGFTDHCAAFHLLVEMLQNPALDIPRRDAKIRLVHLGAMYSGKDDDDDNNKMSFLNNGNVWLCDSANRERFSAVMAGGQEKYDDLQTELRGKIGIYQYRCWPEDYPNRHGHGNGNPSQWALRGGMN